MTPRTADPCPHELRPGLTVCLHCRRAERDAKSAHIGRILSRITWGSIGFAMCVGLGYVGANAVKSGGTGADFLSAAADLVSRAQAAVPLPGRGAATAATAASTAPTASPTPAVAQLAPLPMATAGGPAIAPPSGVVGPRLTEQELPLSVPVNGALGSTAAADTVAIGAPTTAAPQATIGPPATVASAPVPPVIVAAPPAPPPPPRYTPRIAQGRTELGSDGLYAVRDGDVVRVHFDTDLGRTRRAAKFEQIVRATLPAILGAAADSLLRQVPDGRIASSGNLLGELPQRGVELRHVDGRSVTVWPETRAGRDGPIVVAYRVAPTR